MAAPAQPASGARQSILPVAIKDEATLYQSYMPFIKGGGLFAHTPNRLPLEDHRYILSHPVDVEDWAMMNLSFSDGTKSTIFAGDMVLGGVRNVVETYTTGGSRASTSRSTRSRRPTLRTGRPKTAGASRFKCRIAQQLGSSRRPRLGRSADFLRERWWMC